MSILQLSLQLLHHEVAVPRRVVQLLLQQVLPHLHSTLKRLLIFQIIHADARVEGAGGGIHTHTSDVDPHWF